MLIREETAQDISRITNVNEQAFGRAGEAQVVDALRNRHVITVSLVAIEGSELVGHILFSLVKLRFADGLEGAAMGLGPMAILPQFHGRGIGSRLVETGLALCKERGFGAVIVLGHSAFYSRLAAA